MTTAMPDVELPTWLEVDLEDIPTEDQTCTFSGCRRRGEWISQCRTCGVQPKLLPDGRRRIACNRHRRMADRRAAQRDRADRRRGMRFVCYRCRQPLHPVRWVHV